MKIALTIWGNRISPVFESAGNLMIVQVDGATVTKKTYESCDPNLYQLVSHLKKSGIQVLICGAISEPSASLVSSSGISLIPFITGNATQILEFYLNDTPVPDGFFMPTSRRPTRNKPLKNAVFKG